MKELVKDKKKLGILCAIIVIVVIAIIGIVIALGGNSGGTSGNKEIAKVDTNEYTVEITINPDVKLNYTLTCNEYKDGTRECEEPQVHDYELVNDDAKRIFNGINVLDGSRNLFDVIQRVIGVVESSDIEFDKISIDSDWEDIHDYLAKKNEELAKQQTEQVIEQE